MNPAQIFLPSCALVLLTYVVMFSLFLARLAGMKENRSQSGCGSPGKSWRPKNPAFKKVGDD